MHAVTDRKKSYKLPPTIIRDKLIPQEARRTKALEEQKRRRAQRIDSSRQLDLFADLHINDESDEDIVEDDAENVNIPPPVAVAPYLVRLQTDFPISSGHQPDSQTLVPVASESVLLPKESRKKSKKRNKKRNNGNYSKPSKWADQCMYAELLEMPQEDESMSHLWSSDRVNDEDHDSLPKNLENGWVAVAPVPVGKRCLVVTHQSAGLGGVVPNTTLRSRLLGKCLIPRFPSPLPPMTVLDCILDANWRDNGILHILDVVRWKGQDVGDCEAPFRFWWRDTRLGELSQSLPPTLNFLQRGQNNTNSSEVPTKYQFPYPTYFVPIPYHTNTSLATLDTQIIPDARSTRSVVVEVPLHIEKEEPPVVDAGGGMEVEMSSGFPSSSTFSFRATSSSAPVLTPAAVNIQPDGLLLYVSEASFEPGTSPLSNWVPIMGYDSPEEGYTNRGVSSNPQGEGPLDVFHRLVKRRLQRRRLKSASHDVEVGDFVMEMNAGA